MTIDGLERLGYAQVDGATFASFVAKALHSPTAEVITADVSTVDYPIGTIATGALMRVTGQARDAGGVERPYRVFVKQLQSAAIWPNLHFVPEPMRQAFVDDFPWRIEIDAFHVPLRQLMPAGFRMPELYGVVEIDPHRAAIWMEDVETAPHDWPAERFERAAHGLGVLAGRRPSDSDTLLGDDDRRPDFGLRMYAYGRVQGAIAALDDDEAWSRPALASQLAELGESSMRSELLALRGLEMAWLERLADVPHTLVHGDASPQNLLVPADDPESFVLIDWSFNSPHAVGFDLTQLLVGLVNNDLIDAKALPELVEVVVPAFTRGLADAGVSASEAEVRRGFELTWIVRDLFPALELDGPPPPDTASGRAHCRNRIVLTRFLLELAKTHSP